MAYTKYIYQIYSQYIKDAYVSIIMFLFIQQWFPKCGACPLGWRREDSLGKLYSKI